LAAGSFSTHLLIASACAGLSEFAQAASVITDFKQVIASNEDPEAEQYVIVSGGIGPEAE
jgi:hypothetical protein